MCTESTDAKTEDVAAASEPTCTCESAKPATPSTPAIKPRPLPRPGALAAPAVTTLDASAKAEAAKFGRVDSDGTVWVKENAGERVVGQYAAQEGDPLELYIRRYLDLSASVKLLEDRLNQVSAKESLSMHASLLSQLENAAAVGDLDSLRSRLQALTATLEEKRETEKAARAAAKAEALAKREDLVDKAEAIVATPAEKMHWKQSNEKMQQLLEEWKGQQKQGPRLDRNVEDALWKRFSGARTAFDRARRHYFSELDAARTKAKAAKEALIAKAEELSTSTDWGRVSGEYRKLLDQWRAAGRASHKEDEALWTRFRTAQQRFFDAKDAASKEADAEYAANLAAKLEVLEAAEALLPVTDVAAAKAALRPLQDKWDTIGYVPRSEVSKVENRMRAVENAIKTAEQTEWHRSNPETKARAEGMTAQLTAAITKLEEELEQAKATGDAKKIAKATEALSARKQWLDMVQKASL